jgi:hypothetical protein
MKRAAAYAAELDDVEVPTVREPVFVPKTGIHRPPRQQGKRLNSKPTAREQRTKACAVPAKRIKKMTNDVSNIRNAKANAAQPASNHSQATTPTTVGNSMEDEPMHFKVVQLMLLPAVKKVCYGCHLKFA